MNPRRLYRSRTDRVLTGIAGGMAEYLEVDPTIVRILWVLAAIFTGGLVLLLYIVLAFVIPVNPYQGGPIPAGPGARGTRRRGRRPDGLGQPGAAPGTADGPAPGTAYATGYAAGAGAAAWNPGWNAEYERSRAARTERPGRAGLIIGSVLIVFGVIALADVVIPGWLSGALVVPGLLVALGVGLLVASLRASSEPAVGIVGRRRPAPAPFVAGRAGRRRLTTADVAARGRRDARRRLRRRRDLDAAPAARLRPRVIGVPLLLLGLLLVLGAFGPEDAERERGIVTRFLRSPLHPATWLATGAIVAGFGWSCSRSLAIIGILSTGVSLLFVGIGVVLIVVAIEGSRIVARIERRRALRGRSAARSSPHAYRPLRPRPPRAAHRPVPRPQPVAGRRLRVHRLPARPSSSSRPSSRSGARRCSCCRSPCGRCSPATCSAA